METTVQVPVERCHRCGHIWPKKFLNQRTRVCPYPGCRTPYWEDPPRNGKLPAARARHERECQTQFCLLSRQSATESKATVTDVETESRKVAEWFVVEQGTEVRTADGEVVAKAGETISLAEDQEYGFPLHVFNVASGKLAKVIE